MCFLPLVPEIGAGRKPSVRWAWRGQGRQLRWPKRLGTTDQTDVFLIDKNGQLNVFSLDSNGKWGGLVKVGSQNLAPSGSPLVVSPQFGVSDRLDVFVIGQTDANHQWLPALFSQVGTNPWQGPDFSLFH